MPEIAGTGDNWFISHHQEGYVEVLEVALPSNRRVRLEYIDGGEDLVLKVLTRREDLTEKWEAISDFKPGDLDGLASLLFKADDMIQEEREDDGRRHPWRWLWRLVTGWERRRDDDGGIDEDGEDPFTGVADIGSDGDVQELGGEDRRGVPADAGGGGGDPRDKRAPSGDGPEDP